MGDSYNNREVIRMAKYAFARDGKNVTDVREMKAKNVAPWRAVVAREQGCSPSELEVVTVHKPAECPTCGATGADPCVTATGRETKDHAGRG